MKTFIVLYYAPADAMKQMEGKSAEEMQEGMKPWMTWAEKCGNGLVDLGAPLGNGKKVGTDGASPSESDVTGYSILQAESMDDALKMLEAHPHLGWTESCSIEVYEAMPLPGQE